MTTTTQVLLTEPMVLRNSVRFFRLDFDRIDFAMIDVRVEVDKREENTNFCSLWCWLRVVVCLRGLSPNDSPHPTHR